MTILVPIALFGWIPLVVAMFFVLPTRFAVGLAYAGGWCFLPVAGYTLPVFPDYDKTFAMSLAATLGLLLTNPIVFSRFRPSTCDIPAAVWCLSPMASNLSNRLGIYDGSSAMLSQLIGFGLPYFIGRCVYRTTADLKSLAVAILVPGLLYVPLCMWEIRMSPQLHVQFYGFFQHSFGQTVRFGGWRPIVFMNHGLQVGLWMASCFVIAFVAWRLKCKLPVLGIHGSVSVFVFGITVVLVKSLGAWVLVAAAVGALLLSQSSRRPVFLIALIALAPAYIGARTTGVFSGKSVVRIVESQINASRAESLEFRLKNEEMLMERAWQRPLLGWGGWGRNRVTNESGDDVSVTDGLWIIIFGVNGFVGLIVFYTTMLWGPLRIGLGLREGLQFAGGEYAIPLGLSLATVINVIDSLPNAMIIPAFFVVAGALSSYAIWQEHAVADESVETDVSSLSENLEPDTVRHA